MGPGPSLPAPPVCSTGVPWKTLLDPEEPTLFTARRITVYSVPFVNPVIVKVNGDVVGGGNNAEVKIKVTPLSIEYAY
jgi:hypothetical protein